MKGYTIVQSVRIHELISIVNDLLREGYMLAGGMTETDGVFYQTLYRMEVQS